MILDHTVNCCQGNSVHSIYKNTMKPVLESSYPKNHLEQYGGRGFAKKTRFLYHRLHVCMCVRSPGLIVDSAWNCKSVVWLVYRFASSVVASVLLVTLFVLHSASFKGDASSTAKFFIYLTHWSFILLTVTAVLWAFVVGRCFFASPPKPSESSDDQPQGAKIDDRLPWFLILLWVMININTTTALGVTLGYWLAVYKPGVTIIGASTIFSHVVNSIIVLLDVILSAVPFRLGHFYQPLVFGLFYAGFSVLYYFGKGTTPEGHVAIYQTLDWRNPQKTLLMSVFGGIFVVLILHALVCLLSLVRRCIVYGCRAHQPQEVELPC